MMYSAAVAQVTGHLGSVLLIATGTYLVLQGAITLGTMLMVVLLRAFFVDRLNNCVNYLMELRRLQSHTERIDEVVGEAPNATAEPEQPLQPFLPGPDAGLSIEVKDVWFRYGADSAWVLKGVSATISPGEAVAITGPSGCGKTTLLGVMLGLLEPTRGEVHVNGRDLRSIATNDYARLVGVVMQDDILFQGTVAENISFFEMPIDAERVKRCAIQANIAADIEAMPLGYYSLLAEAAADISGGQKQRLFIARALYHAPRVLFLDEATSHLDSESERLVSDAIRRVPMTRVLIAHRRETIATAQRVLVMRDGQVTEVPAGAHLVSVATLMS
jgi:ATP-binding cassette subfamily B protein RaxB